MNHLATVLLALLVTASSACGPSLYRRKPEDPQTNTAVTSMWEAEIRANAESGDWILTRSYSAIGDVIAIGSLGEEISHSVIYDADRNTIIEAITPVVREVPLRDLLDRNRIAIVVRPHGTTSASRRESVARARKVVGNEFDYTGLLGAESSSKFYCSELVVWASDVDQKSLVITPASLLQYGEIVYLSGHRDDHQVQAAAHARAVSEVRTAAR